MLFSPRWIDVTYEAAFSAPLFDLPTRNVAILKAFHETISPRFAISLNDLQVTGGATLGDVRARVVVFGGNGIFDIFVEKFAAAFTNLRTQSDIEIVKDCMLLANHAMRSVLPTVSYREVILTSTLFLNLQGPENAATEFLDSFPSANRLTAAGLAQGTEVHYGLLADFENSSEAWRVTVRMERSYADQRILIIIARASYGMGGTLQTFSDQAAHLEGVLEAVFKATNLKRDPSS